MVSPSKHKKLDRKGRANIEGIADQSGSKKTTRKIFDNKKIYLDINNRSTQLNLEKKLKTLGAVVEPFLVRDVSLLITDRETGRGSGATSNGVDKRLVSPAASVTPSPSPSPSPSPINVNSPTDGAVVRRTRSRAEAMLESVRQQPAREFFNVDPLENAKAWKIPIYNLQKFYQLIEKRLGPSKTSSSGSGANPKIAGVKVLRGCYIKLEAPGLRPEFRALKSWPRLSCRATGSPFDSPNKLSTAREAGGAVVTRLHTGPTAAIGAPDSSLSNAAIASTTVKNGTTPVAATGNESTKQRRDRMTRRNQVSTNSDKHYGGYCEMCGEDYLNLAEHISSLTHIKVATDPAQFAELDSLIKESVNHHGSTNGDLSSTLNTANSKRVLRSSRASVSQDWSSDGMGNKQANSDKQQQQHRAQQMSPRLSPLAASVNHVTATNGHVTRSTTAHQRQQSLSSSGRDDHHISQHNETKNNKSSPLQEVQCNGLSGNHCHLTRLSVKTESLLLQQQQQQKLSPCNSTSTDTTSGSCHHLRSKKQLWLPSNLLGTTAEDEGNPPKTKQSEKPMSPPVNAQANEVTSTLKNRRRKMPKKRLSVEEKLIEDNKSYYKVEVLNSKLRSTGYYMTQRELELNRLKSTDMDASLIESGVEDAEVKVEEKQPVVVRFKKVRKSELSLLSDEAESFMFSDTIRKDSEDDVVDDNSTIVTEEEETLSSNNGSSNLNRSVVNSSQSNTGGVVVKKEEIAMDDSSIETCCSGSGNQNLIGTTTTKRKRRTHAEMFIHDNLDYYKFDIQGSRLRLHSGVLQPLKIDTTNVKVDDEDEEKFNVMTSTKLESGLIIDSSAIKKEDASATDDFTSGQLSFSFENVPDTEDWYQAFKRQDEFEEIYHPMYSEYPKVKMLYEYPSLEKQKLLYKCRATKVIGNKVITYRRKKRRRRFLKSLDDKPRKSPRCHASTLAILSSLKYRRSKKDLLTTPEHRSNRNHVRGNTNNDDSSPSPSRKFASTVRRGVGRRNHREFNNRRVGEHQDEECCVNNVSVPDTSSTLISTPVTHTALSKSLSSVVDNKPVITTTPPTDNTSTNMREVAENIEQYFYQSFKDNMSNDKYYHVLKLLRSALKSNSVIGGDLNVDHGNVSSCSGLKGKRTMKGSSKASLSSTTSPSSSSTCLGGVDQNNGNHNLNGKGLDLGSAFDMNTCLDIDPDVVDELRGISSTLAPGPEVEMSVLMDNYKYCNSMERADYEHLHPRAIDALRAFNANDMSCNSSDCGGSSTCELLGFTEDGRTLTKRRKRKKRNMTGWPKDKPRRLQHSLKVSNVVDSIDRSVTKSPSCVEDDLLTVGGASSMCGGDDEFIDEDEEEEEEIVGNCLGKANGVILNETPQRERGVDRLNQVDDKSMDSNCVDDGVKSVSRQAVSSRRRSVGRALSRTASIDSTVPLSEYSMCIVRLNNTRKLRGSNSIDSANSENKSSSFGRTSSPEKRSPGRLSSTGRRPRRPVRRWSPWLNRRSSR